MSRLGMAVAVFVGGGWAWAAELTEAKFTQVVNDVSVISTSKQSKAPAKVDQILKAPDLVRTGPNSRAELRAPDQTLTRVGANTVFAFDTQGRNINLQQGSVLFHSPTGKGGGTVKTGGAAAAVLGKTIMVVATPNGGFKGIVLEGKGKFTLASGRSRSLNAGQLLFVLPGGKTFGPTLNVNLSKLVQGSSLIKGYNAQLPSLPKVEGAVSVQQDKVNSGELVDTGLLVASAATENEVQVVSQSVFETAIGKDKNRLEKAWRDKVKVEDPDLQKNHLFDRDTKGYPNKSQWADDVSYAFIAQDIDIDTPLVRIPVREGADQAAFGIIADEKLDIKDSVRFVATTGDGSQAPGLLLGGDEVDVKDGSTIRYDSVNGLGLGSKESIKLDQVRMINTQGAVSVQSSDGTVRLEGATLVSGAKLANGQTSAWVPASLIDINAKNNIRITSGSTLAAQKIRITAKDEITLTGANFHDPINDPNRNLLATDISMAADTLILANLDFPANANVRLGSKDGLLADNANTGQAVVRHKVNFITGVSQGGELLRNDYLKKVTIVQN